MRTEKSLKNIKYSFIGQILAIVISLVSRYFFLKTLNATYLGVNGLFTNILTVLSFVELGVGPALTFSLYEPLKSNDREKIKSLLLLFKRCYIIIGIVILILGFAITPFLPYLISDLPDIQKLDLIYWLFVINTGVSYFGSYKKTLLTSDQSGYIVSKFHYVLYFLMNLLQIIILLITHNFIFYLIIQIVFTILENITLSIYVDKKYKYLKERNIKPLDSKTKDSIKKNTKAMVIHKFGSIVVTATDNLILSKYVGLLAVGIYSNYYLIINNIHKILKQLFNSIIASVGNLGAEGNKDKLFSTFKHINFINYYLQSLCSILMIVLFQDFILFWVGEEYLFSIPIVIVLVICFYFSGLRTSVLLFKEALGLYWQDRYKAFFEAIINLVVSIILIKILGVIGVFLGTLISTLTTCFWIEPYILFKYGFDKKSIQYFKDILLKTLLTCLLGFLCFYVCDFITGNLIAVIIIKAIVTFLIVNIVYYVIYRKSDDFIYIKKIIRKILKRTEVDSGEKNIKAN